VGETEKQAIRRKVTGVLVRHARLRAGRSQTELAAALHVSRHRYGQYELGQHELALPQLEAIAAQCGVPLGFFFDDNAPVEDDGFEAPSQVVPRLRRKIVGALLREARQCAGKTQKECAAAAHVTPRLIGQYENGDKDVPPSELEALAEFLGMPVSHFSVLPAPA
jgi:transcriptional regulator with XRE-family HTH domain